MALESVRMYRNPVSPSIAILFVLVISSSPPTTSIVKASHGPGAPFLDVGSSNRFEAAISWSHAEGIVQGYPDGTFRPDNPVNRAEFLKMVLRSQDPSCSGVHFWDVPEISWYEPYVCDAARRGWVRGYPDGAFHPSSSITFVEAAKIVTLRDVFIYRGDVAQMDESVGTMWYWPYVKYLVDNQAYPSTAPSFDWPLTRGELVDILHRLESSKEGRKENPAREVSVAFYTENELSNAEATASFVVARPIGNYLQPANAALRMLFAGPSREEVELGARTTASLMELLDDFAAVSLYDSYSPPWKGADFTMKNVAIVSFRKPAGRVLNAVTAEQFQVKAAIEETLKKFQNVQLVLYKIDGVLAVGSDG